MSYLSALKTSSSKFLSLSHVPFINNSFKRFRNRMVCDACLDAAPTRPCFELDNCTIERGGMCHAKMVRSFLYEHYWPRDPCTQGLWVSLDAPSLSLLTEKYAYTGDRFIALERIPRTGERRIIGMAVANRIFEWEPDELDDWAHSTADAQERGRLYFAAHCYRGANLWNKYNTSDFYEVEVLVTAAEVSGQGVATMLLKRVIDDALELRTRLIVLFSRGTYSNKVCERVGMKKVWSVKYADFVDHSGICVFFPRRPHSDVTVYVTELKI